MIRVLEVPSEVSKLTVLEEPSLRRKGKHGVFAPQHPVLGKRSPLTKITGDRVEHLHALVRAI